MVSAKMNLSPERTSEARILSQSLLTALLLLGLLLPGTPCLGARDKKKPEKTTATVQDYSSRNFLIHTDLPPEKAKALLQRLETMLRLISTYWGRPPSGIIECNVVENLEKWTGRTLAASGIESIQSGAGITITRRLSSGDRFVAKATVYSCADFGVVQHEVVHAYCHHTFGRTGPTWYSEGMAEMGQYWREGEKDVQIQPPVLKYLQESPPKTLRELIDPNQYTGDSWQNYAWRWALCHLLANNPNYAPQFRPLGLAMLTGQNASFESIYGPMAKEISFEYLFFLKHIDNGYRADLCAWNWKKKSLPLASSSATITARIQAGRGWQPAGLMVTAGTDYQYAATGQWQTEKDGEEVGPDGAADGRGRLVGIFMKDHELVEPFDLGASGAFQAKVDGNLYLRCHDRWNQIHDNTGTITVKFKRKAD